MIFLAAKEPNVHLKIYGAAFSLEPIKHPEVNTSHILVMENELARRTLDSVGHKIQRVDFEAQRLPGFPAPLTLSSPIPADSRILIIRGGGIGDVLMCLPAIRELKKRLPSGVRVSLSTFRNHCQIFSGHPDLDEVLPQPLPLQYILTYDYLLEFDDPEKLMSRIHMTDFYLSRMGIAPHEILDKRPSIPEEFPFSNRVTDQIKQAGNDFEHTVYLNGLASDRLRDVPPLILALLAEQYPDILFIVPEMYIQRYPASACILDSTNVSRLNTGEGLAQYVTAIACSDMVVTTDSSAYHIAAGFDKPCLTLFGPVDPSLRTTYYPNVIALESTFIGETCKSPCGKSMFSQFYDGRIDDEKRCPEAVRRDSECSPCLASFSSDRLTAAFDQTLSIIRKNDSLSI